MDETEGNARLPFDWLGFAALSVAIGALQLMLDRGEQLGLVRFRRDRRDGGGVGGGASTSSSPTRSPPRSRSSPFDIFRDRNFAIGLAFMFVCGMLLVATMAVMAPFLQGVMGFPIIDVGLLLGTRGIGMAIGMVAAGRLIARIDPRLLLGFGLACCVVSLYYTIDFSPDTAVFTIVWTSILQGIGLGAMFVPLNTLALGSRCRRRCARRAPPCGP